VKLDFLIHNSAWARLEHPSLSDHRLDEIADAFEAERVGICLPFLLEAGYSARGRRDHEEMVEDLLLLPLIPIDEGIEWRTISIQRRLADIGHHRMPPVDLVLAAIADRHELPILHYDADFDLLRKKTDLEFESAWLAPPGSL
jgi:predicted nucleic acid-binding protein